MITKDPHAYRVRNLHQEKGLRDHGAAGTLASNNLVITARGGRARHPGRRAKAGGGEPEGAGASAEANRRAPGRQRRRTGRDSRPWMRLLGRQRSSSTGTASDKAGNRASSAPNAISPSRRASGAPRQ